MSAQASCQRRSGSLSGGEWSRAIRVNVRGVVFLSERCKLIQFGLVNLVMSTGVLILFPLGWPQKKEANGNLPKVKQGKCVASYVPRCSCYFYT